MTNNFLKVTQELLDLIKGTTSSLRITANGQDQGSLLFSADTADGRRRVARLDTAALRPFEFAESTREEYLIRQILSEDNRWIPSVYVDTPMDEISLAR